MNKHIEVVKKWLADKDSVSQDELVDNASAARAAAALYNWRTPWDADEYAARAAAACASFGAAYDATAEDDVNHCIKKYEELTSE